MKKVTMKHLCLILSILVLPTFGFSQFVGDSLIIYVDNRVEMKVAVPDYNILKSSDNASNSLQEFQSMLPEIKDQLSLGSADLVTYSVGSSLTIKPGDPTYIYLIKNDELSKTGFRDRAIISGEKFKIFITTSDLSKISDLSLSQCLEKAIALLPRKGSWSKSLYYECINESIKELDEKSVTNAQLDQIEFTLGAGAGLVKSNWVPDLSFRVGLAFNRKGVLRFNPYVSTNLLFDFVTENNTNINTFLNLGYRWNVDRQVDKPEWLGVELGYLIVKQGDLFGENTFKLGLNWSPVKGVFVSPHIYVTDNFKTMFPGIRIGFGL